MNLPPFEAAACLAACALALVVAEIGAMHVGAFIAASVYGMVRAVSVVARKSGHRVANTADPLVALVLAGCSFPTEYLIQGG